MVVDEAGRLHEGIGDHWAEELHSTFLQIGSESFSLRTRNGCFFVRAKLCFPTNETPGIFCKASEFFLDGEKNLSVTDSRSYLQAVADDANVFGETIDISLSESGNFFWIKTNEGFPISLAPLQDRFPRESGLSTFEDKELEEDAVVSNGAAPFLVMIGGIEFISIWDPAAANFL